MSGSLPRQLFHIPIIHDRADLGVAGGILASRRTDEEARGHESLVARFWMSVEEAVTGLDLHYPQVRLYQDGLPVCGREHEIVAELAAAGSHNHRLLQRLIERGAILMGTESGDLLVEEYDLLKRLLTTPAIPGGHRTLAGQLLVRRDAFIAKRINQTLRAGESGLLFLGLMHAIAGHLDNDIVVHLPIGEPQLHRR